MNDKEQQENKIKTRKRDLGFDWVFVSGNAIMGTSLAGFSIYSLAEGNYTLALFQAGVGLINGYCAYNRYQHVGETKEILKKEQSQLEKIVE